MLEVFAVAISIGAIFYHSLHASFFIIALVAGSLIFFFSFVLRNTRGILFSIFLGIAIILGAIAVWNQEKITPAGVFGNRAFDAGVVSVDRKLGKTNIIVRDSDHNVNLQLYLYKKVDVLPGDSVSVRAVVESPEAFITDTGRLFDYPQYLASKGIVGIGKNAQVLIQEEGSTSSSRVATKLRFSIADTFSKYLSYPVDGIIAGMTVGYQGGLPKAIGDLFRDTGVLHVLVLSGYNITLLAGFLGLLLRGMPFRIRTILIMCAIALIVLISGAGVASLRAGIMGSIALFAGLSTRTYRPLRAFTFSYLLFFFLSPQTLFSDPGFHLSFLATAYMLFVLPKTMKLFSFIPKTKGIDLRELSGLAISIPLFMLPYTMYFSGNFPLISPLANIGLSIISPILMILGIVVLFTSWLPPLVNLFGLITTALTTGTIQFLEWCSKFPIWNTPPLSWWGVVLFYFLFFVLVFRKEIISYAKQLRSSLAPATNSFDS